MRRIVSPRMRAQVQRMVSRTRDWRYKSFERANICARMFVVVAVVTLLLLLPFVCLHRIVSELEPRASGLCMERDGANKRVHKVESGTSDTKESNLCLCYANSRSIAVTNSVPTNSESERSCDDELAQNERRNL